MNLENQPQNFDTAHPAGNDPDYDGVMEQAGIKEIRENFDPLDLDPEYVEWNSRSSEGGPRTFEAGDTSDNGEKLPSSYDAAVNRFDNTSLEQNPQEEEGGTNEIETQPIQSRTALDDKLAKAREDRDAPKEEVSDQVIRPETVSEQWENPEQRESPFGLSIKDLEGFEGAENLSEGQKHRVLENFNQVAFQEIKERALRGHLEDMTEASKPLAGKFGIKDEEGRRFSVQGFKNLGSSIKNLVVNAPAVAKLAWKSATKEGQVAKKEQEEFQKLMEQDVSENQFLAGLVKMAQDGPAVEMVNGRAETQYLSQKDFENVNPEEQKTVFALNHAVAEFERMPQSWGEEGAKEKDRNRYEAAKTAYENARKEALNLMKEKNGDGSALKLQNEIDREVAMRQYTNANPEVVQTLSQIRDENTIWRGFNAAATSRGGLMVAGGFARALTGGIIFAPIVGGVVGYYKGKRRGETKLTEQDVLAKGGTRERFVSKEGVRNETARNIVIADADPNVRNSLSVKLDNLVQELNETKTNDLNNGEKIAKLHQSLQARIGYTQDKLGENLVDFGSGPERIANQHALMRALGTAQAETWVSENDSELTERLNNILGIREKRIDEAQKKFIHNQAKRGAKMGAGFAFGGAAIADIAAEVIPGGSDSVIIDAFQNPPSFISPAHAAETVAENANPEVAEKLQNISAEMQEIDHKLEASEEKIDQMNQKIAAAQADHANESANEDTTNVGESETKSAEDAGTAEKPSLEDAKDAEQAGDTVTESMKEMGKALDKLGDPFEAKQGNTVTGHLDEGLKKIDGYANLNQDQQDFVLDHLADKMREKLQSLSPNDAHAIGFSTQDLDLIYKGSTIELDRLLPDSEEVQKILSEAQSYERDVSVPVSHVASSSDEMNIWNTPSQTKPWEEIGNTGMVADLPGTEQVSFASFEGLGEVEHAKLIAELRENNSEEMAREKWLLIQMQPTHPEIQNPIDITYGQNGEFETFDGVNVPPELLEKYYKIVEELKQVEEDKHTTFLEWLRGEGKDEAVEQTALEQSETTAEEGGVRGKAEAIGSHAERFANAISNQEENISYFGYTNNPEGDPFAERGAVLQRAGELFRSAYPGKELPGGSEIPKIVLAGGVPVSVGEHEISSDLLTQAEKTAALNALQKNDLRVLPSYDELMQLHGSESGNTVETVASAAEQGPRSISGLSAEEKERWAEKIRRALIG